MKGRSAIWLRKKTKRGFRGYPIATVGFYGPTAERATKIVASIVSGEGAHLDPLERWFSEDTDVRRDLLIGEQVIAFLAEHGARSVLVTDGIIGCPQKASITRMAPLAHSVPTGLAATAGRKSGSTELSRSARSKSLQLCGPYRQRPSHSLKVPATYNRPRASGYCVYCRGKGERQ
jgi:hypothetical protein